MVKQPDPFSAVYLKNFVLASREVFERQPARYLEIFKEIQAVHLPKLEAYLKGPAKQEYPLLGVKKNFDDINSYCISLRRELEDIIRNQDVEDKFVKYDEQVRK